jgi:thioredoxin-related protein
MRANSQNTSKNQTFLPIPTSLPGAAREAAQRGEPFVLMVSVPGCPWCELLRRNYLGPLRRELPRPLAAFEISLTDAQAPLTDFDGQASHARAVGTRLGITTTPTVLFFNPRGQEIAPRIEGVASVDFIGAVLDERIAQARERLKS